MYKMNKIVKNTLAAVGAVTLVTAAPVLSLGVVLGAVAANPEKAKQTAQDLVYKVKYELGKLNAEEDDEPEEEGRHVSER